MNLSRMGFPLLRTLVISTALIASLTSYAERFGGVGGYHPNGGYHYDNDHADYNGDHYNDAGVGYYHPGSGWVAPVVESPGAVYYNSGCQTINQCSSNGGCVETQVCN